ncbi:MAG: TonB-dependent receptor [Saprospiraceae bacterium]|nr:TonB-dependent receptor [Saprospiraceae bacterium]
MRSLPYFLAILIMGQGFGQQDTLEIAEIVISATRTEKKLTAVPMPTLLIKAKEIQITGTSRLQDLLTEQVGLSVVPQINGFGNGLQVQGLNPDYTLIMVDGEPVIGRLTGNLELNRFTLGNVKQVEIVKGPSSSLYGSEALGGVVNILTQSASENKAIVDLKHSTNNTYDLGLQGQVVIKDFSLTGFVNHFRTDGFDLFENSFGQVVSPYYNTTLQLKPKYEFKQAHVLSIHTRWFKETQDNQYQVISGVDSIRVSGQAFVEDLSLSPRLKLRLNSRTFLSLHYYYSKYSTQTELFEIDDQKQYYTDDFKQELQKPEFITNLQFDGGHTLTAGAGAHFESVETSRYGDAELKEQQSYFGFAQHEWSLADKWEFVSGLRYDRNAVYGNQWSPKFALQYTFNKNLSLKASVGTGFKAPDFRYLYLNFRNSAAAYSVFGTEQVVAQLQQLEKNGEILLYFSNPNEIGKLDAERSLAFNLGLHYNIKKDFTLDLNLFRNDLEGLIESIPVAMTTDMRNIYSYDNIKQAYTHGGEVSLKKTWNSGIQIHFSSQWLFAKDKEIVSEINRGQIYGRDPVTKESYRISQSDYFGLYNRSRHTEMVKVFYTPKQGQWDASIRMTYKSKFGIQNSAGSVQGINRPSSDINGNAILDRYDHFVDAYVLVNASLGKTIGNRLYIQCGAENITDFKDPINLPQLPGRILFIKLNFKIFKNNAI